MNQPRNDETTAPFGVVSRRLAVGAFVVMLIGWCSESVVAESWIDPALHFRTRHTEHFIIYFHQGEEPLAARLAGIAERAWRALERPLGTAPPRLTHVVLVDQTDLANGWATPLPYDTIMVTAAAPAGSEFIGRTDDWLTLVFVHEFTHIVHLDRSEGWARLARRLFGRMPLAFPNLLLPVWQVEGLATFEESVMTGEGRLHAGDFRAIEREAARAGTLEPLDRVNGGLTRWPGGLAPYAYGLGFHQYLVDRFGEQKIRDLAEATARSLPFLGSRAFRKVYGEPLGRLWHEYEASVAAAEAPQPESHAAVRLTHHGFTTVGPRFAPPSCDGCAPELVYSIRTPHEFPALRALPSNGEPRSLATRYLGSTTGVSRETIVFDQQELARNASLYSDLFALDRVTGHVRRLTREARLIDPDLSPDSRTIVCVQERAGGRDLVVLPLRTGPQAAEPGSDTIQIVLSDPETYFNAPRWSPDGRLVAVERHRPGRQSEIVLVNIAGGSSRIVASAADARIVTPAWRPDGAAIVASADAGGGPFNLFEFDVEGRISPRQLTTIAGGATWPDVSPDGRTIAFIGYTTDGFDLFTMEYPTAGPSKSLVLDDGRRSATAGGVPSDERLDAQARRYVPWPTLSPTSWTPIVSSDLAQTRLGVASGGRDVLGYHAYAVSATWLMSGPDASIRPSAARPDWQAVYAYARWRPTFFASASSDTSFFAGPATARGTPASTILREQQVEGGVVVPFRHVRATYRLFGSFLASRGDYTLPDRSVSLDRVALRAAWAGTTAHVYGYSISPERGIAAGSTVEIVRHAFGADADATVGTADVRVYAPGLGAHHVLAGRVGGGVSSGDPVMRRSFHLGGGRPDADVLDFGRDAFGLLRGFAANSFAGSHVAVVNAEYRWPLARPERGVGTWPLFLHTIHAAVFGDAAHAWTGAFRAGDAKTSTGVELSLDLVAAYSLPFTAAVGAALGHDGAHLARDSRVVYARIGRAF